MSFVTLFDADKNWWETGTWRNADHTYQTCQHENHFVSSSDFPDAEMYC